MHRAVRYTSTQESTTEHTRRHAAIESTKVAFRRTFGQVLQKPLTEELPRIRSFSVVVLRMSGGWNDKNTMKEVGEKVSRFSSRVTE